MSINEEIGHNYHTKDNRPISRFNDPRITVEIFPGAFGDYNSQVSCEQLEYSSGLRKFATEQEAILFATNAYQEVLGRLNSLTERIIERLLLI